MSQIKKFTDKIAMMEGRGAREVILTLSDAKELRDDILKILVDQRDQGSKPEIIEVVMNGGKW